MYIDNTRWQSYIKDTKQRTRVHNKQIEEVWRGYLTR